MVVGKGADHVTFENNTAKASGNVGNMFNITTLSSLPGDTIPGYITFKNNNLENESGSSISNGILLWGEGNIIEGNTIKCKGTAISAGFGSSPTKCTYKNNTITNGGNITIYKYSTAEGNVTDGNVVVLEGAIFTGNTVGGNLTVNGNDTQIEDNTLNNNVTINKNNTTFIKNGVTGTVTVNANSKGNTITENSVVSTGDYAVILKSTASDSNTSVENNTLVSKDKLGDDAVNPGTGSGNTIQNNNGNGYTALQDEWIQSIADMTYTGEALEPEVVVKNGNTTLTLGTDYQVAYKDNKNAGTATVTITRTEGSSYGGKAEKTFTINRAASTPATVAEAARTYDGTEKPLVNVDNSTLVGGEMQYALGTEAEATEDYTTTIPSKTDAGTYYVWYKVVGDANHNNTLPVCVEVKIDPVDKTDLKTAIESAETYYDSIKEDTIYAAVASALQTAIVEAKEIAGNDNVTAAKVSAAIEKIDQATADAKAKKKDIDDTIAANAVSSLINALPGEDEVRVTDAEEIAAARKAYDALTKDQKAKVSSDTVEKLTAAERALTDSLDAGITGIDKITKDNMEDVRVLLAAYDELTYSQKAAAEEAGKKIDDLKKAFDVAVRIDKLKSAEEITAADEKTVMIARTAYELLLDAQKDMLGDDILGGLLTAEAKLDTIKAQDALAAEKASAVGRLQDYAQAKALADATEEERDDYFVAVTNATEDIMSATTKGEVAEALTNAKATVDAALAEIEKDRAAAKAAAQQMSEADKAVADAGKEAESAMTEADAALADEYASEADKTAIGNAKADVEAKISAAKALGEDATAEQKTAAAKAIEDAVLQLKETVDTAKVNSAAAKAAAEEAAEAAQQLAAAKSSAVERLDDYSEAKAKADTTEAEKAAYDRAVADGKAAINEAATPEAAAEALKNAKAAVDAALAKIEKDRADAKAAAQEMSEADKAVADAGKEAESAKTEADQATADEYVSDADKTAIADAKADVEAKISAAKALGENATAEQKNAAAKAIEDAVLKLNTAVDTAKVNSAAAKAAAEEATEAAQQLAAAKASAVERLDDYSEAKAKADATEAEKAAYDKAVADGKAAINEAATPETAAEALKNAKAAVDATLAKIEKNRAEEKAAAQEMSEADKAVADAGKEAESTMTEAAEATADEYATEADKTAIGNAKADVEAKISAAKALGENATAEQKNAAAKAIEEAVQNLNTAVDTAKVNSAAAKAAAEEVAEAVQQLADARKEAKKRLEDVYDAKNQSDYRADQQKALEEAKTAGEKAIDEAATPDEAEKALVAAKEAINAIKTDATLTKEKKEADDTQAALAAMTQINDIFASGNVKLTDKAAIEAARKAYEALSDDQKAKVDAAAKKKLESAEASLKQLEDSLANAKKAAAKAMAQPVKVKAMKKGIKINWTTCKEADGYDVYVQYAGKKFKKVTRDIKKNTTGKTKVVKLNGKKLNRKKAIRVYVSAYKMVDGKKVILANSRVVRLKGKQNSK